MDLDEVYEVWVDVGGTFTDCFLRTPGGELRSTKVLSSGKVPIEGKVSGAQDGIESNFAAEDPMDFWVGAECIALTPEGEERIRWPITASRPDGLTFPTGLLAPLAAMRQEESKEFRFEIDAHVEAPLLGARRLLRCPLKSPLPHLRVRLGTTRGTNALLTRGGTPTALAITAPFQDLLRIGDQTRPDLFDLAARKPEPIYQEVCGIRERLAADGTILHSLDERQAKSQLQQIYAAGCRSLAICLMHAYLNPLHEQRLKQLACDVGFEHISCSSELAPLIEIVARAQTAVVDAYLSPTVNRYLAALAKEFGLNDAVTSQPANPMSDHSSHGNSQTSLASMQVMTSAGGLVSWDAYSGKDSILSGPAGGAAALQAMARAMNVDDLIGLDMGGTSTDVCRITEATELQYESEKAGVRILTPTLPIETVASGGGSICWFDGVSLRVGPQSAGASPGPACYGRGGPLTITDVNVFVGRIPAEQFPFPLHIAAIQGRIEELRLKVCAASGGRSHEMTQLELADGLRRIANEQMAEAVRTVSISQGADPRRHTLVGFGGAAGQHICEIAELLGVRKIVDSKHAGLLSSLGMGMAEHRLDATVAVYRELGDVDSVELKRRVTQCRRRLAAELQAQGAKAAGLHDVCWAEVRYVGADASLRLPFRTLEKLSDEFHQLHETRFGSMQPGRKLELVAMRLQVASEALHEWQEAKATGPKDSLPAGEDTAGNPPIQGRNFALIRREEIRPGDRLAGPVIVLNQGSTLVVDANWIAECWTDGSLVLTRAETTGRSIDCNQPRIRDAQDRLDIVFRDCFAARLSAIATQMGHVLRRTATSTNVKRRLDFSCAVFDAQGQLLANAPHVPVHLGAMGQTVRTMIQELGRMVPGESYITNDPFSGGSHLPDITLVTPIFNPVDGASAGPVMFVANRAHHADIGGISPGSMSVKATRLDQEGVLLSPMRLPVDSNGELRGLYDQLRAAPYPPRNIEENLADISAQLAANHRGVDLLQNYAEQESWSKLTSYCEHLLGAAEERVRQFLRENLKGERRFEDRLDDGTAICVSLHCDGNGQLNVSFSGTGPVHEQNFNANPSIVQAAVMYVLRCLIADEMPLNEGVMRCVTLNVPECILNPSNSESDERRPAVAAGNVETSQRVVDVLLGALGVAAASQGTMNNLLFGNESFGFYETICGGAGATATRDGESGVHTHMTNTRVTDPEVLEARYPVRLTRFELRHGSGGAGKRSGGNGVVREMEFLEPVTVSLLTSRRLTAPFGLQGGQSGLPGHNRIVDEGQIRELPGCCEIEIRAGQKIQLHTPGGGGFGIASKGDIGK